jgi:hypothetical protein
MESLKAVALIGAAALSIFVVPVTASAASPFKKVTGGTLHIPSGVILPARVGAFQFVQTKLYGSAGRDAGAGYNVGSTVRGDVYFFPLGTYGRDFEAELRIQQNAIKQVNQAVKQVSQARFQLNQSGRTINGVRVQYELTRVLFTGKARRCGSQLYLFRDGPWLFQYRFSYPIEQSAFANKQIADFMRLWQWRAHGKFVQLNPIPRGGRRG